ncbi:ferredoxin [Ilumatobacter coccineus]|uniref:Ferredoxin n=1 Tax=Ilumatobacter coccineus (strain NBRC 103263 / KCTC 29153 / YM16-304) TaxID=1313172 RepID=A0A6C7EBQ7_ILUCY|nr:ferredoxin [Ilumatobacter coccineus]BAN02078.1 putative 3Fe-4S ferredoxin [Ilumatobacter coccineus YM16-304]
MNEKLKVSVDREICVAGGQCVSVAPQTFDQDDDGIVVLVEPEVFGDGIALAEEAAFLCPSRSITVERRA